MPSDIELHLEVTEPVTAIDLLAEACDLSRSRLKQVMICGAVWLENGQGIKRLRRAKAQLKPGEKLHFYYDAETIDAPIPEAQLLADLGEYSVWLKPQGMYSQGTKWGDHHTIGRWAEKHLEPQRTAKIVHRLDRYTWGVMLLAHSKGMAATLTEMFRERRVRKVYLAIASGCPVSSGETATVDFPVDDKSALSHVTVLDAVNNGSQQLSLCKVEIETGRKHQVRSHLQALGAPIVGDRQFSKEGLSSDFEVDMQLCATSIEFECPLTAETVIYRCPDRLLPQLERFL